MPKKMSSQSQRFIDKAREIGADEKSSAADTLLGRLAKMPPQPKTQPRKADKSK
jgi:hypothetical protein